MDRLGASELYGKWLVMVLIKEICKHENSFVDHNVMYSKDFGVDGGRMGYLLWVLKNFAA